MPLAIGVAPFGAALAAQDQISHHSASAAPAADAVSEGEVRKVDKEAGKITIKHGPLKNLGMPAMTMAFRVKDPAMLERVKAGDRIRFVADKVAGVLTVMQIESAQ
jgi:Cu/Ag efflux protein CusF